MPRLGNKRAILQEVHLAAAGKVPTKKRTRSSTPGHIRSRGKNTWQILIYQGPNSKPQYRSFTVHGSKSDAEHRRIELQAEFGRPVGDLTDPTVLDILTEYVQARSDAWAPRTQVEHERIIRRDLVPLHGVLVRKLTPQQLQAFRKSLGTGHTGKARSGASVRRILVVLKAALTFAEQSGVIRRSPAAHVTVSAPLQPRRPPSAEKVRAILAAANESDPRFGAFLLTLASTGARRGEVLGLRWSNVNYEKQQLSFKRTIAEGEGGWVEKKYLKQGVSKTIAVPQETLLALEGLQASGKNRGYVFSDDGGKSPWLPNRVTKTYRRLQQTTHIEAGRLHDLRHFHATQLLNKGFDVASVAKRLGHRSPYMTLNVYSHAIPATDHKAAGAIGGLLFPDPNGPLLD
jgi:integrase